MFCDLAEECEIVGEDGSFAENAAACMSQCGELMADEPNVIECLNSFVSLGQCSDDNLGGCFGVGGGDDGGVDGGADDGGADDGGADDGGADDGGADGGGDVGCQGFCVAAEGCGLVGPQGMFAQDMADCLVQCDGVVADGGPAMLACLMDSAEDGCDMNAMQACQGEGGGQGGQQGGDQGGGQQGGGDQGGGQQGGGDQGGGQQGGGDQGGGQQGGGDDGGGQAWEGDCLAFCAEADDCGMLHAQSEFATDAVGCEFTCLGLSARAGQVIECLADAASQDDCGNDVVQACMALGQERPGDDGGAGMDGGDQGGGGQQGGGQDGGGQQGGGQDGGGQQGGGQDGGGQDGGGNDGDNGGQDGPGENPDCVPMCAAAAAADCGLVGGFPSIAQDEDTCVRLCAVFTDDQLACANAVMAGDCNINDFYACF